MEINEFAYFFTTLLCNMVNTFILYRYYHYLFHQQVTHRIKEVLSYAGYFVANSLVYFSINIPIVTLVSNFILFYLLTFNYAGKQTQKLFAALFYTLLYGIFIETAIVFLTITVPIDIFGNNLWLESAGQISITIFTFLAVEIIGRKHDNNNNHIDLPKSYWLAIFITPLCSFFLMIYFITLNPPQGLLFSFCCLLFLFINTAVFFLYGRIINTFSVRMKTKMLEQQNTYYSYLLDNINTSTETTKRLQHDQKNHFITMKSLLDKQEYEKLNEYFEQIYKDVVNAQKIIQCGNTTIDSILNFKIQEAKSKNISVDAGVAVIPELQINNTTLTIILGNLLDNAIEATSKVTENRQIKIKIFSKTNCLFILISNPYAEELKKQGDLFLSTKPKGEHHGLGLQNVFNTVTEHGGTMAIHTEDHFFTVKIALFANEEKQ